MLSDIGARAYKLAETPCLSQRAHERMTFYTAENKSNFFLLFESRQSLDIYKLKALFSYIL